VVFLPVAVEARDRAEGLTTLAAERGVAELAATTLAVVETRGGKHGQDLFRRLKSRKQRQ
jgi:hypothetical protein